MTQQQQIDLTERAEVLESQAEDAPTDFAAQGLRKSARKLRDKAKQQQKNAKLAFTRFRRLKLRAWLDAGGSTSGFDREFPETDLRREFTQKRADEIEAERARGARRWARAFWR